MGLLETNFAAGQLKGSVGDRGIRIKATDDFGVLRVGMLIQDLRERLPGSEPPSSKACPAWSRSYNLG